MRKLKENKKTYFIKRPSEKSGRATFKLVYRIKDPYTKKIKNYTVQDERIDIINLSYKETKNFNDSLIKITEIKQEYQNKEKDEFLYAPDNQRMFRKYWKDVYELRDLKDPQSARNRLQRGIRALGQLSLYTANRHDLQKIINSAGNGRELAAVFKQFLKYIQRSEITLTAPRKTDREVRYIPYRIFKDSVENISDEFTRTFVKVLFATGCRTGEAFDLDEANFKEGAVYISGQMRKKGEKDSTKNNVKRHTPIVTEYISDVEKWCYDISPVEKQKQRNKDWTRIVGKLIQGRDGKAITPHELRHSYAIYLLSKGINLTLVAQALGNSLAVCQEYYTGFALGEEGLSSMITKLKNS